ncbi:hypothetical protein [Marinomonas sp. IMCC 4694]|uniref:hypothetical protein n=1 Tax=Marinomonas sp. IMCC 4694 TaxID=2605432 RepID=UPI0011E62B09|nr:hypothetical protein [Marinomonas sp. IMCC 4694]TYL46900.1 hypothetical protein FXV75_02515 [Marinomonas sp. IMCC 4694]
MNAYAETTSIVYECDGKERQIYLDQLSFVPARTGEKPHICLENVIADSIISVGAEVSSFGVGEQQPNLLKLQLWDMNDVSEFKWHSSQSFGLAEIATHVPFAVSGGRASNQVKMQVDDFVNSRSDNPTPDKAGDIALADIEGIHSKVKLFLQRNSTLDRGLLPLTRNEVRDYLTLLPIILVEEDGKYYCVAGIQSYLQAFNALDKKEKVPVRWFQGKIGLALKRLNTMEVLGLPIIFSTKKYQLQQTFDTLQTSFSPLYKQSFFASCSSKQFAALFGVDTRTIQEGGR